MTKGHSSIIRVSPTLFQFICRITRPVDSYPLQTALGAAAMMIVGFIGYQFTVRPDFKALRIGSNATPNIDKPIAYHSNRLLQLGMMAEDPTPKEVKEIIKSVRSS